MLTLLFCTLNKLEMTDETELFNDIMDGTQEEFNQDVEDTSIIEIDEGLAKWEEFAIIAEEHFMILNRYNKNPKKIIGNKIN